LVWASKKSALATLQLYWMSPSETNEVPLIEEMEYIVPRLALVPGIGPVSTYNSKVRTHGMISQSFSQKSISIQYSWDGAPLDHADPSPPPLVR